jgi:RimJ/RimL family protein N-acetyltransferase
MHTRGDIRFLSLAQVREYVVIARTCDADSGTEGRHYHPYSKSEPYDEDALVKRNAKRWSTPLTESGWRRAWAWVCDGRMVGEATLVGGSLQSELHRVGLGMGLLPAYRGIGGGSRLLQTAIDWARAQPTIDWIDLGVFADNEPAHTLYVKFGFVELGRTPDQYRVDGAVLDNIAMSLFVGAPNTKK